MERFEHDAVFEYHIHMGVGRSTFSDFIAHTPIEQTGRFGQYSSNALMGEAMVSGVVNGKLELAGTGFSRHLYSFHLVGVMCTHYTGLQRVILPFATTETDETEVIVKVCLLLGFVC
jgi:hypothetical protein